MKPRSRHSITINMAVSANYVLVVSSSNFIRLNVLQTISRLFQNYHPNLADSLEKATAV